MKKTLFMIFALAVLSLLMIIPISAAESTGDKKTDDFINDSRWAEGTWWGNRGPVISSYDSGGCAAYCADYVKYCFDSNNPRSGSAFYSVNEIRNGDVVIVGNPSDGTGHWFVVLKRSGNSLYVAEGNFSSQVRIGWNYTISGSKFAEDGRSFTAGYHFLSKATVDRGQDSTYYVGETAYIGLNGADSDAYTLMLYRTPTGGSTYLYWEGEVRSLPYARTFTEEGYYSCYFVVDPYGSPRGSRNVGWMVKKEVPVTGVQISDADLKLHVGETKTLTAVVSPSDATNKSLTWYSSNTSVATVDQNGKVTAKAVGTANIIVRTVDGDKTAQRKVTVTNLPIITSQPVNKTTGTGGTVTFRVTATGTGLSYQWQYSMDNGGTWYNSTMTGYNTSAMQVPVAAGRNGYLYRCIVKNSAGSVTSSSAKLTVNGVKPAIRSQTNAITSAADVTAAFKVVAAGTGLGYKWQYSTDNGKTWHNSGMTGYNTATLKVPVISGRNGYLYRCIVSNSYGSVTSSPAKLTVSGVKPVIRDQTKAITSSPNVTVTFKVAAAGVGLKYKWQYSNDGGKTWHDSTMTGYNTAAMKVPVIKGRNGYQYRCIVSNSYGSVTSSPAKLTVK